MRQGINGQVASSVAGIKGASAQNADHAGC